jgi:excinuclease ABC subunit C
MNVERQIAAAGAVEAAATSAPPAEAATNSAAPAGNAAMLMPPPGPEPVPRLVPEALAPPAEPVAPFDAKSFVDSLPGRPGVYRMLDANGEILYVGKARNLKSRVGSYFQPSNVQPKVQALVAKTARVEVTITNSDTEALLLEFNLIKKHRPRFNVVLRDDKSFPYLHFETDHEFPRLAFYRGSRKEPGRFFGPYPSAGAVRETLQQVQKLFRLRNCDDNYFANRSRPCLQYQIQRCTAPCVGLISKEAYARDVGAAIKVLEGRNDEVRQDLGRRMEAAAQSLHFEEAAQLRDQMAKLQAVQAQQIVNADIDHDADVIAIAPGNGEYCVALMFVRGGRSLGSTTFFPKAPFADLPEVMAAFVTQYYLERDCPPEIIVETPFDEMSLLETTLAERTGHKVRIASSVRGIRARWVEMMHENAEQALTMRGLARASIESSLEDLRDAFDLTETPHRIECFDISHTGGTDTVASCVVFGEEGPIKSEYRRFNISGIQPGDDYAAMYQALTRRYKRVRDGEVVAPDVLLIDGGKGQLAEAAKVLDELGVSGITLIGVAKGPDRRPGQEQLFLLGRETPTILAADSKGLHLIQRVRDEAHRFAITGHRRKRAKRHSQSILETIPGLGPVKRRELLKQFGGLQGILRAGIEDFVKIRGLGRDLAEVIYEHLHPGR